MTIPRLHLRKASAFPWVWVTALLLAILALPVATHLSVARGSLASQGNNQPLVTPVRLKLSQYTPVYPVRWSRDRHYLVDQHNVPFLLLGDSPQALIVNLTETEARMYFATRRAQGFNAMWINLLCNKYTGGRDDGSTYDGLLPFLKTGDLATPNPKYFQRVDYMLQLAANHHLLVFLDPIETGGWLAMLKANGLSKDYDYGQYLGKRYRRFKNIVWMSGNDFQTWSSRDDSAAVKAVMQGLHDADPSALQTIELNYYTSGSLDDAYLAKLLGLDAAYTYYPTYAQVLKEFNRAHMPVFMVEAHYDGENVGGELGTPLVLRRQEYWSMLSGAAGQLYGSEYWNLHAGWQQHLSTIGTNDLAHFMALFAQRRWYDLIPDQSHSLVTSGYGTFSASGNVSANDYVTAARTRDRKLAIIYIPTRRTISVAMSSLVGKVDAYWYDPTTGKHTAVSGSPSAHSGIKKLTPPGDNGDGDGDWVLVLESK